MKKWYVVWHQDSPGTTVTVRRWFRPRSGFSRVGEPYIYGQPTTYPTAIDARCKWITCEYCRGESLMIMGPAYECEPCPRCEDGKVAVPITIDCKLPPRGWWCSLPEGHEGPCPTYATFWNIKGWWGQW